MLLKFLSVFLFIFYSNHVQAQLGVEWAKSFSGYGKDMAKAISIDNAGNVFTTGYFDSTCDFDPSANIVNFTTKPFAGNCFDVFISKLDAAGNYAWAKQLKGNLWSEGLSIANDSVGNVFVTGFYMDTIDVDPSANTFLLTTDIFTQYCFVLKLDGNGNFVWAKQFASTVGSGGIGIAVDQAQNIIVSGWFMDTTDFDPGIGVFNLATTGYPNTFICKLTNNGNFVWAKQFDGAANTNEPYAMSLDKNNNIYTTGRFKDSVDLDPNIGVAPLNVIPGNEDIYISKLDENGNYVWAKQLSSPTAELLKSNAIVVDKNENVFLTGWFSNKIEMNPSGVSFELTTKGWEDIFIAKLNAQGAFEWAKQYGGVVHDVGMAIDVDDNGDVYTAGNFQHIVDFDPGTSVNNFSAYGATTDIFINKLSGAGNFIWNKQLSGINTEQCNAIKVGKNGEVYSAGYFYETMDCNPDAGVYNIQSLISSDVFIHKMSRKVLDVDINFIQKEILIYPNPTSNVLHITSSLLSNSIATLIDVSGKVVLEKLIVPNQNNAELHLSHLMKGIYILQIKGGNINHNHKIIIE
jgi:Secretion system C-terminal sorting domain